MGWKCGCVFVGDVESGYFGTNPAHSPEKAREILRVLGFDATVAGEPFWAEIYPEEGSIAIGAFEKGAFIAMQEIGEYFEPLNNEFFAKAMSLYPQKSCLALGLHSVVNFAAFALYRDGQVVRNFACAADDGVYVDYGAKLAEEEKQYVDSFERDGQIVFPRKFGDIEDELDISSIGEEIVFDLSARALGRRYDTVDENIFTTEKFSTGKAAEQTKAKQPAKPFWKFW